MNVYIVQTDTLIYPFLEKPADLHIANQKLSVIQVNSIIANGCHPVFVDRLEKIIDPCTHLIIYDNIYINAYTVRMIIKKANKIKKSFACAFKNPFYNQVYLWHINRDEKELIKLPVYYVASNEKLSNDIQVFDFDCKMINLERFPKHMEIEGRAIDHPVTPFSIIPIENWVNLWQANIAALMEKLYNLRYQKRYRQILPFIRSGFRDFVAPQYMNRIGKKCRIHPSAIVEGSIIGNNVYIGANAVVRLCHIDDNVYISDQALVRVCCLGEGSNIGNNNCLNYVVTYPQCMLISGPYQFSLFGRESAVMHCIDCDTRLDLKAIQAQINSSQFITTGLHYLGACFGHKVRIGAGTISAPGSAYPNGVWINPDPALIMKNIKSTLPTGNNLFCYNNDIVTKEQLKSVK